WAYTATRLQPGPRGVGGELSACTVRFGSNGNTRRHRQLRRYVETSQRPDKLWTLKCHHHLDIQVCVPVRCATPVSSSTSTCPASGARAAWRAGCRRRCPSRASCRRASSLSTCDRGLLKRRNVTHGVFVHPEGRSSRSWR